LPEANGLGVSFVRQLSLFDGRKKKMEMSTHDPTNDC